MLGYILLSNLYESQSEFIISVSNFKFSELQNKKKNVVSYRVQAFFYVKCFSVFKKSFLLGVSVLN
jgi:hypothetical protein